MFCLSKFEHLSKKNKEEWIQVIQSVENSDKGIAIISYLQYNLKKDAFVDLPCYISPGVQEDFRKRIWKICKNFPVTDEDTEIAKILAPLTDNPNVPNENGRTPIYWAAYHGHIEIVKILASLTDNPNAPDKDGETPIHWAASNGHKEIVNILAPLTDNEWGHTSSIWQNFMGILKLSKFSQKFSTMLQNNTKH